MANEVVKYHNDLNTVPFRRFNSRELDLFFAICAKMKGKENKEVIFSFGELKGLIQYKFTGKQRFIDDLDSLLYDKLLDLKFKYDNDNSRGGGALFTDYDIDKNGDYVTISVNEKLTYILNQLERVFTRFELEEFTTLRSSYAKNMYRLLKQWKSVGKKSWSIEEFRRLLDIPESYPMREIDKRVLTPIETELSPIFKGLSINKEKKGRGGKVTSIEFTFQAETVPKKTSSYKKCNRKVETVSFLENELREETPPNEADAQSVSERIAKLKSSNKNKGEVK